MITFVFSFKQVGGVPSLYFNIANELHRRGIPFRLICYYDSEIFRLFEVFDCEFIDISRLKIKEKNIEVCSQDVLIITCWIPELELFKKSNPRILFWNVFPFTLPDSNLIYKNLVLHWKNKLLINSMLHKKALIFMDQEPFKYLERYGFDDLNNHLVPIPITIKKDVIEMPIYNKSSEYFNITYIGRAVHWKLFPLVKIIEDLNSLNLPKRIRLHIITDNKKLQEDFVNQYITTSKIIYQIKENLPLAELVEYLDKNSDLNIGMGTACLESAALKIPSLLVKASYEYITGENNYKWLYNTTGFSLGSFNESETLDFNESLSKIVKLLITDEMYYTTEGEKCFQYINCYHSISSITDIFIKSTNSTTFTFQDAKRNVFNYSLMYKMMNITKKVYRKIVQKK